MGFVDTRPVTARDCLTSKAMIHRVAYILGDADTRRLASRWCTSEAHHAFRWTSRSPITLDISSASHAKEVAPTSWLYAKALGSSRTELSDYAPRSNDQIARRDPRSTAPPKVILRSVAETVPRLNRTIKVDPCRLDRRSSARAWSSASLKTPKSARSTTSRSSTRRRSVRRELIGRKDGCPVSGCATRGRKNPRCRLVRPGRKGQCPRARPRGKVRLSFVCRQETGEALRHPSPA